MREAGAPSELTLAVRAAASTAETQALARLEQLLRSGVTVEPHEEPPIVEAVYRSRADAVLPLLIEHGADPDQLRSDGVPVLDLAARRRDRAAAVDVLLHHGARPPEQPGEHIVPVSADSWLVRGDQAFFGWLIRLLEHGVECSRIADPNSEGYHSCTDDSSWVRDACGELIERVLKSRVQSPCRPENVLLIEFDQLCTVQGAVEYCGDCVVSEYPTARDTIEGIGRDVVGLLTEKHRVASKAGQPVCSSNPRNASS